MPDPTVHLVVPRATGTAGDDLIAWGLARVLSDAIGGDVILSDEGTRIVVDTGLSAEELDDALTAPESQSSGSLYWLASHPQPAKAGQAPKAGKPPPDGLRSVQWEELKEAREAMARIAQQRGARTGTAGEPSLTLQTRASLYHLYRPLTTPNTQWLGYNTFVSHAPFFTTSAGLRLIVSRFREHDPLSGSAMEAVLASVRTGRRALFGKKARWLNSPGFLFFAMNKGPTRPVALHSVVTIGKEDRADRAMADRGDLSAVDLYLAYVGYFSTTRILDTKKNRAVVVPIPFRIAVPRGLDAVRRVVVPNSALESIVAAQASLVYARAVVAYLVELRHGNPAEASRQGNVLQGVALAQFMKPSGNTYAPIRAGLVPLPRWLGAIFTDGWEEADATLGSHQAQLRALRGGLRDEDLSSAQRDAYAAYRLALDGDVRDWFRAVAAWFPALRDIRRNALSPPRLWTDVDIRRIAVALDPPLAERLDHPSFLVIAGAIRAATVGAHRARVAFRDKRGPRPDFDPEYDLVEALASAAERSPADFITELCRFVARYNAAAVRPNLKEYRHLVGDEKLRDVVGWLEQDRRGLVAAALLAFGTCWHDRDTIPPGATPPGATPAGDNLSPGDDGATDDDQVDESDEEIDE